jgi:hypothetical protein
MSAYAIPENSSILFLDYLKISNTSTLTIPNTATVLIQNTNHPRIPYWDAIYQTPADYTTASLSLVDIPGLLHTGVANGRYHIKAFIVGENSSIAGMAMSIASSIAVTKSKIFYQGVLTGNTIWSLTGDIAGNATSGYWTFGGGFDGLIEATGHITLSASGGNITAQVKKFTSGTVTIYQGSSMSVRRLA